jgi:hypothetical protein
MLVRPCAIDVREMVNAWIAVQRAKGTPSASIREVLPCHDGL